jgi:hypothetical protein
MPRSSSVRSDLFITVGGDVAPLKVAMTAGRSVLNEFGSAAIDVQAEVTKAFAGMAANAPAEAKRLEQAYSQTFNQIRKNAQQVLSAGNGGTAANIINATGATQAAAAAEGEAAALRMIADAAARADAATMGNNAGTRAYAVAAEAAAQEAAQYAAGLRSQAQVLGLVQTQLVAAGGQQQKFGQQNLVAAGSMGNARIAQLELMHVVRGSVDQLAAGASATQVLAMHMSMLGQAAALSGDSMGKFGRFMGGPYGLLLTVGISVLAMLISRHGDAKKSAEEHRDAEETLTAYINGEKVATDALITTLVKLNEQESRSLDSTHQQIQARYDLAKATLAQAQANKTLLETQLSQAKAELADAEREQARAASGGKGAIEAASGDLATKQAKVDSLQQAIGDTNDAISQSLSLVDTELVKLARDLTTHVGRANAEFDRQLAALEAKYRGTPKVAVDAKGNTTTTYYGGSLNQPGVIGNEQKRQQLLKELTTEETKLNIAREKGVAAARELDKAELGSSETAKEAAAHFKSAVVGAEGTGANLLGSSAAGFGQFMPKTWLSYFNRLFPDKASLSDAAKLGFRNVREVASAVIDKATDDYVAVLKAAGQAITQANLYAVHLLGAGDAKKLLSAAAGTPTSSFLSAAVLRGNPFLRGTAEHARSAIASRIGDSSGAVSSGAAAIEQALVEQHKRELEQDAAFDSERNRLNEQLLSAIAELATGYEAEARAQLERIDAEHATEADKIRNNFTKGVYGDPQTELAKSYESELQLANDRLRDQRRTNVLVHRFMEQQDDLQKSADDYYQSKIEGLRYEEEIARTADERRRIELDIIDALYAQRKYDLEIARKKAAESQRWDEVARLDAQLANLPTQKAREVSLANRNNQSPLDAYKSSLPKTLGEVEERLQEIEVTGLKQLEDDLASATAKALGLKGALGDIVSELVKLGLQLLESYAFGNNPLSGLFGGGRATGGPIDGSKFYLVGEHGPELFAPGISGSIIPNHMLSARPSRAVYGPSNDNGSWRRGGGPEVANYTIYANDADSFRRSERQIRRDFKRRYG